LSFAGAEERLAKALAASRNMGAGVFFSGVGREVIFTTAGGIDEFEFDIVADAFEMAVAPEFPIVGCS